MTITGIASDIANYKITLRYPLIENDRSDDNYIDDSFCENFNYAVDTYPSETEQFLERHLVIPARAISFVTSASGKKKNHEQNI